MHHALCQTIVRTAGTPHAETNAVMLPHSARMMLGRAPDALASWPARSGTGRAIPTLRRRRWPAAARCGHTRLSTLGVRNSSWPRWPRRSRQHPLLGNTPDPPGEAELLEVLREAL